MALSTLDRLKQHLDIVDSAADEVLQRVLDGASAWLETQCGYDAGMTAKAYTFTFSGEGTRGWTVSVRPVVSVASITVDGVIIPEKATDVDGWYLTDTGRVELSGGLRFTRGQGNCVVVATCGYATVPADVESAALTIAGLRYQERHRPGQVSGNVGGVQVTFSTYATPADVAQTISAYSLRAI